MPPDSLRLADYDFALPEALVAQRPAERRDGARMLVLDRAAGTLADHAFHEIGRFLRRGDALALNNTRVVPARLVGRREPGGGAAELLLVERAADGTWTALARPGRKLREGARVTFGGPLGEPPSLRAEIARVRPDGRRIVRLVGPDGPFDDAEAERAAIETVGRLPLPPYVARDEPDAEDRERYQTVFARHAGAVAAPTAGLHFTPEVLAGLSGQGVGLAEVTLHVGYGTFEPVKTDDLGAHAVAPERAEVTAEAAAALNAARDGGGRVVAVGTTSVRTLETAAGPDGRLRPFAGPTGLTITPGYRFRAVDALLTNFHLPRSSLLVLVATFAGREATLEAYAHAVREGYRFYSYGDCMLIA